MDRDLENKESVNFSLLWFLIVSNVHCYMKPCTNIVEYYTLSKTENYTLIEQIGRIFLENYFNSLQGIPQNIYQNFAWWSSILIKDLSKLSPLSNCLHPLIYFKYQFSSLVTNRQKWYEFTTKQKCANANSCFNVSFCQIIGNSHHMFGNYWKLLQIMNGLVWFGSVFMEYQPYGLFNARSCYIHAYIFSLNRRIIYIYIYIYEEK